MSEEETTLVRRDSVLAVCGCGHDGRLGFGNPLQHQAVLSVSRVTLVPFFLDTLASMGDRIRSVHCGGYHTIVLTQAGGLYGWGLHEEGQLGFGRLTREGVRPSESAPRRMTFFDELYESEGKGSSSNAFHGERKDFILEVSCGAAHSMVLTACGLYVCGKNTYGQLGTGTEMDVFEWVLVSAPLGGRRLINRCVQSSDEDSLEALPLRLPAGAREATVVQLVKGELTHVSCGTHHSLLAWKNALLERYVSGEDGKEPIVSLEFHPVLIMSSGKGDFGELGYDGDQMNILHAREKRQSSAIQSEAKRTMMQGGVNTDDNHHSAAPTQNFSSGWWKKKRTKERRPEFFSTHFLPVQFEALEESVVRIESGVVVQKSAETPSVIPGDSLCGVADRVTWEVLELRAMHLHSSVTLRQRSAVVGTTAEKTVSSVSTGAISPVVITWHWGCYYCHEVEGLESSIPRVESWESSAAAQGTPSPSIVNSLVRRVGIHAANEALFRYGYPPSLSPGDTSQNMDVAPPGSWIMSKGSGGVLGNGDEDGFSPEWTSLAFSEEQMQEEKWMGIEKVVGRDHVLLAVRKQRALCTTAGRKDLDSAVDEGPQNESQPARDGDPTNRCDTSKSSASSSMEVWGFGANLHGQLCAGEEDQQPFPTPILRPGDIVRLPPSSLVAVPEDYAGEWKVLRIRDIGAGSNHSVFLVDVASVSPIST